MPDREPTPADFRALISDVSALQDRIRSAVGGLRDSEETRHTAFRLGEAVGELSSLTKALEETAGDLARVRSVRDGSVCAVPWGVCPEHGNALRSSGGKTGCTEPGCSRTWGYDRLGAPCGEPLTHTVTDAQGSSFLACRAHAADASERLLGSTVALLDPQEDGRG
ncbi:hypothetical protein ACI2LJ_30835 [Streptomyces sp. NPDC088090]|uniref:hypothetical protein n=1 Tax=Streptomyces sp. NPDC088090 TaxID=3365822 RepID=UPI00384D4160